MPTNKKTKIVATLGPACSTREVLKDMIDAGVNVFRVNFSHADYDDVKEKIDLITNGITGEMKVNICIDDLTEYSISEDAIIDLKYSLNYVSKMCLCNLLSSNIEFSISAEKPMRIKYNLGDDSAVLFYIAPKIID